MSTADAGRGNDPARQAGGGETARAPARSTAAMEAGDREAGRALERVALRVRGRRTAVLATGVGPPVVLVHGLGLSADVWRPHLAGLARLGYAAVAPDLPGFGESDGPATGQSVPATAAWLEELAAGLGLGTAAWVGHSVSAQALLRLAVLAPARAAALVLAGPTGRPGRHLLRQAIGLVRTAPHEPLPLVARVTRLYLTRPAAALGTWIRAQRHDALGDAAAVMAPSLVVLGREDPVVPREFGERLARALPRSSVNVIEGAAHAVALDPFPPFLDAVAAFLDPAYRDRSTSERWKSSGIAPKFHGSV